MYTIVTRCAPRTSSAVWGSGLGCQRPGVPASSVGSAKVSHLGLVPQGQPERLDRVAKMVGQMEAEAFGSCTNHRECEAVCPKEISIDFIARMNRDFLKARLTGR